MPVASFAVPRAISNNVLSNPYLNCVRSRRRYGTFVKLLGLHNLAKVQAIVAPTNTSRDQVSRTLDGPDTSQPETYDIAL